MMQKKTTLVIGAGASFEVNLPLGTVLKSEIGKLLNFKFEHFRQKNGNVEIFEALRQLSSDLPNSSEELSKFAAAGRLISESISLAISIDNFIDAHKGNKQLEIVGKLAIAYAILKAERASKLYIPRDNIYNKMDFISLEKTWYKSIFQIITENCQRDGLPERLSSLTLIIFNYDRCVEFFLIHALKQYYDMAYEEAYELVSMIKIMHPYGFLGSLPSQDGHTTTGGIRFGEAPDAYFLTSVYTKIRTFTEGTDPTSSEILAIRNEIANSEILVFLGFAYHHLNMELLQPAYVSEMEVRPKKIFGTAYDISFSNTELIRHGLARLAHASIDDVSLKNVECNQLFYEYGRSLSLS